MNSSVDTDGIARGCGPLYRGRGEAEEQQNVESAAVLTPMAHGRRAALGTLGALHMSAGDSCVQLT
jgi:hypothetical protein